MPSTEESPSHLHKRSTLVKVRLGCTKMSTYDLPSVDHTYGLPHANDPEGAGEIISNWVASNPSVDKESEKKLVYSNVLAIKNGAITAKSMRQYAIDHPSIRRKESLEANSSRVDNAHEGPFGKKTQYSEVSMDSIMKGSFASPNRDANEDSDYPNISHIKKIGGMPKPKATIASSSIEKVRQAAANEQNKTHFCMKRFQNVKGKLNLNSSF